ncbi:MAG: ABC transporter ATP-binding protein [Planctomycetaceae bacterium]
MTFFRRIWAALERDRRLMAASVLFGLIFTALGIVPPLLVGRMVRALQSETATTGLFVWLGALTAGVYLLRGTTRYLYGLCSHVAAYRTLHRMLGRVFGHLQTMSPSFCNERHSGNLVARSVGDVQEIEDFIAHGIPESMLAVVIPVTMSVVLFVLNWQLALLALAPLPVVAAIAYVVKQRTQSYWSSVRGRFADLSASMQDHLAGLATVQSFTAEDASAETLDRESRGYRDAIIHANSWSLAPAGIIEAASGAGLVLLVTAGAWMAGPSAGLQVDVADLIVFVMYLGQIFLPFLRLANLTEQLHKSSASAERVFELLDTPPDIVDAANAVAPAGSSHDVAFENVSFSYRDDVPVLQNLSFRIDEGETAALVGVTGAGKTTVCHLLLRFFDVNSGCICVGGHDVRDLKLEFLRRQVALVSQDVFLFQGTIRENLLLADPHATQDELHAAAEAAHCLEFIDRFPDGLETIVGERGVRLSGGQKQRVAIARALLKDAPILVLDEATSAVDTGTELLIRDALERLTAGRTVLIVAHRQSTIEAADRVFVLQDGGVVEEGTYDEVVERKRTVPL